MAEAGWEQCTDPEEMLRFLSRAEAKREGIFPVDGGGRPREDGDAHPSPR